MVPLKTLFYIRDLLNSLPGLSRVMMNSFLHWMFSEPNLQSHKNKQMFQCMVDQMSLGTKYFRKQTIVPPTAFTDEELRRVTTLTLLLIGEQEALYDPVAAIARANQLIPNIQAELIPHASHDLPVTQAETVDHKVLAFLASAEATVSA